MKLGFIARYNVELLDFASASGFDCLEFFTGPGFGMDGESLSAAQKAGFKPALAARKLSATSVILAINPLSADPKEAKEARAYLSSLIDFCASLGIPYITGTTGQNRDMNLDDNIRLFGQVFGELAEKAQSLGVGFAFENCPHGYPRGQNLAVTPELWGRLFTEVPTAALGLEYDPSHLVWQGVDYIKGIHAFADRIRLAHAKDTEILTDTKDEVGIYGHGWWRYRLPGYGEVNWSRFFQALREVGFDGEVLIEHEDPVFEGALMKKGLLLGKHFLDQFIF
jgi:sugar phosphate isomerase/epimerase